MSSNPAKPRQRQRRKAIRDKVQDYLEEQRVIDLCHVLYRGYVAGKLTFVEATTAIAKARNDLYQDLRPGPEEYRAGAGTWDCLVCQQSNARSKECLFCGAPKKR